MNVIRILLTASVLFIVRPAAAFDGPAVGVGAAGTKKVGTPDGPGRPIPAPVGATISRLGDPRFEVREQATKALEQAGIIAIAPLRDAAAGDNLEITCRAIKSLAAILDTDDDATFDAAETALEQLEASANASAARRAAVALESQPLRRLNRSVARLNLLGGGVRRMKRTGLGLPESNSEPGAVFVPTHVILLDRWTGGSAGLVNIKRMNSSLKVLADTGQIQMISWPLPLYVIDGANVSPEALEELQHSLPGLNIEPRGPARLGVTCERRLGECVIDGIEENSGAERAGLRKSDVVVRYDGETVESFDQLTQITRRHKAADRVKLGVQREGEFVELEIELSGWDEFKPRANEK